MGFQKLFLFERGKLKKPNKNSNFKNYIATLKTLRWKLLQTACCWLFCLFLGGGGYVFFGSRVGFFFVLQYLSKKEYLLIQTWFAMAQKWHFPAHLLRGFIEGHWGIDEFEPVLHFQHQLLPVQGHLLGTFSDGISVIMSSLQQHFSLLLDLQGTLVCLL